MFDIGHRFNLWYDALQWSRFWIFLLIVVGPVFTLSFLAGSSGVIAWSLILLAIRFELV